MRLPIMILLASVAAASALEPWQDVLLVRHGRAGVVSSTFPTSGLLSYWSMRNSGTTVYDEYGTNNGTAVNGVLFGSSYGVRGDGANMTATSSQYITAGNIAEANFGTNDFSFALWVRYASRSARSIISKGAWGTSNGWTLFTASSTGELVFKTYQSSDQSLTGPVLPLDEWLHIACVRSGSVMSIYTNGTLAVSASKTIQSVSNTKEVRIGSVDGGTYYADGSVDEVAIWNRALTGNEVYQIYSTPLYYP